MFSKSGYQLYDDITFEYTITEEYKGNEYFKYLFADAGAYILAPTRNITKVTFPFDGYFFGQGDTILSLSDVPDMNFDSLYGFTSVPENKILMKPRTDIGTDNNGKAYVDLGLTSGTLWATMNVGATSETDYGSYFQWGGTVDKRNAVCDWSTYKYNGGTNTLTKYNTGLDGYGGTIDNKLTLDLEDDTARAKMGGDWKMPTHALMEELVKETTSEWVTNYNGTDVNGRKFTSKKDTSKYIFIPASGERHDSLSYAQGNQGIVWSSSLESSNPGKAWNLNFDSAHIGADSELSRRYGFVVRGVL